MSHNRTGRKRRRAGRSGAQPGPSGLREAPIGPGMHGGRYQPVDPLDIKRIHDASLDILEHHGIGNPPDSWSQRVVANGGRVNERGRLCFPRALVEDVIARAGRDFILPGRNARHDLDVSGNRVHFGACMAAVNIHDIDTGRYRDSALADVYDVSRVEDALPNIHFVHRPCIARDIQAAELFDLNTAYALASATSKHFLTSFFEPEHLHRAVAMFDLSLGGEGRFRERPMCSLISAPTVSPLRFSEDACHTLEAAVHCGMPLLIVSAGQTGTTSPATLAGGLVQGNAECLAGLVYTNLLSPGHPAVFTNMAFVSDLRSGAFTGGGGEMALLAAASAQLGDFYNLPTGVGAGITDAKSPDAQSGWEKGYLCAMAGLAGANFICGGAGGMAAVLGFSFESLLIDNDMLGGVLRGIRGIEVTDESLSYAVIGEVIDGPGHFLTQPQTLAGMKRDFVYPELGCRDTIAGWEERNSPDIRESARRSARDILVSHYPDHIDPAVDTRIRDSFDIRLPREYMQPGKRAMPRHNQSPS